MKEPQKTTPPELNEGGNWGTFVLLIFLLGIPVVGVIFSLIYKKP